MGPFSRVGRMGRLDGPGPSCLKRWEATGASPPPYLQPPFPARESKVLPSLSFSVAPAVLKLREKDQGAWRDVCWAKAASRRPRACSHLVLNPGVGRPCALSEGRQPPRSDLSWAPGAQTAGLSFPRWTALTRGSSGHGQSSEHHAVKGQSGARSEGRGAEGRDPRT